jgi:hypothetical protein
VSCASSVVFNIFAIVDSLAIVVHEYVFCIAFIRASTPVLSVGTQPVPTNIPVDVVIAEKKKGDEFVVMEPAV